MKRIVFILILMAVLIAFLFGSQERAESAATLKGYTDKGTFTYLVDEEKVGSSQITWNADGSLICNSRITMSGQTITSSMKIDVDPKGSWLKIVMDTPRGPVVIERTEDGATICIGTEKQQVKLEEGSLIIEDMCPALMSQAVLTYDHQKAGLQTFPLFFIPTMPIQASLELTGSFDQSHAGETFHFRKYMYQMNPIYDVEIVVDHQNRVCLARYPAQNGLFIRDGYDFLRPARQAISTQPPPESDVLVEKNISIPMKDGLKLTADIYRPAQKGKYPVILVRSPYKKENNEIQAKFFSKRGYVFAVQDVRGRFSSPGEWKPLQNEADDGYETIEWLAAQSWSNGKVGMIGASYLGWTQWLAASRLPPHLKAMIPNVSPPEAYFNFPHENGALMLSTSLWWADILERNASADISGFAFLESFSRLDQEKLLHLPVIELDQILFNQKIPYWREWLFHPDYDAYWKGVSFLDKLKTSEVAIFHQSGWFDGDGIGSKLNFMALQKSGKKHQKLILGPWGHTDFASRYGPRGIDWGEQAQIDLPLKYLQWFDRWLKGINDQSYPEPTVELFIMGTNKWVTGNCYPLELTVMTKYYLSSRGDATGYDGKGVLTTNPPADSNSSPDRYTYDPADPTGINPLGRNDILVFKTPPAEKPFTVAGPISAVLYASSSAKDTDWVMRLARIDSQGNPLPLADGIIRARYRRSFTRPTPLQPGRIYKYQLDLWQTGITIGNGESLLLIVSSALFPKFSRNLNTGGHNELETHFVKAEQTIYHDKRYPSHLVLPILDIEAQKNQKQEKSAHQSIAPSR